MNKKYTYVWISLIILIFGILTVPSIVDRIKSGTIVKNDRMNVALDEIRQESKVGFITRNGQNRKVPFFNFINQDSVYISNTDYLGKVYVVEFFFTSCPSICPEMTKNLVGLQETFNANEAFGVASFSITPHFDTPAVLKAYAKQYGITNPDWNLMTGDKEEILKLANSGFNIFAAEVLDAPGGFEHSGLFALVDKKGYLRSRTDEYGNPIVYYRGAISKELGKNSQGETEEISILEEDIAKLLQE